MNMFLKRIIINSLSNLNTTILYERIHTSNKIYAGHSKWGNIKHIKALKDGQRAAIFTKLSRQIRLAIQEGQSSNPSVNTSLRQAIDHALTKNMPVASIQHIIKKCDKNKTKLGKHILEIRTMNRIYIICIMYTDNIVNAKMNIAQMVKKSGGTFVDDAKHLFEDKGIVTAQLNPMNLQGKLEEINENTLEELCTEHAIECGAEEVEIIKFKDFLINFYCDPLYIEKICKDLTKMNYKIENSEHAFIPKIYVTVTDKQRESYQNFRDKLLASEGIEEVYDNLRDIELD